MRCVEGSIPPSTHVPIIFFQQNSGTQPRQLPMIRRTSDRLGEQGCGRRMDGIVTEDHLVARRHIERML
jgi:hypothetical protein